MTDNAYDEAFRHPQDWMERLVLRTSSVHFWPKSNPLDERMEAAKRYAFSSELLGLTIRAVMCSCLGIAGTLVCHFALIYSIVSSVVHSPHVDLVAISGLGLIVSGGMAWLSIKMAKAARRVLSRLIKAEEERALQGHSDDDGASPSLTT